MEFTKLNKEDLSFLNDVRNECAVEYLHDSRTFTLEETLIWFVNTAPNYWLIWNSGECIGYFRTSNYSKINKNIYVGADIHVDYRGKGLAYQAYKEFLPFLIKKYDLHKISLEVLETNVRAINLYKKLGFKTEGIKIEEVLKNGEWVNSVIMSILKRELNENM